MTIEKWCIICIKVLVHEKWKVLWIKYRLNKSNEPPSGQNGIERWRKEWSARGTSHNQPKPGLLVRKWSSCARAQVSEHCTVPWRNETRFFGCRFPRRPRTRRPAVRNAASAHPGPSDSQRVEKDNGHIKATVPVMLTPHSLEHRWRGSTSRFIGEPASYQSPLPAVSSGRLGQPLPRPLPGNERK